MVNCVYSKRRWGAHAPHRLPLHFATLEQIVLVPVGKDNPKIGLYRTVSLPRVAVLVFSLKVTPQEYSLPSLLLLLCPEELFRRY